MTDTPAVSRREANKRRTRAALVAAVHQVLATEGADALTAERVADVAGISRRTFFNYFSSVDTVLATEAETVIQQVSASLAARPTDERYVDGVYAVIEELFTVDYLALAAHAWRAVEAHPASRRYLLEANSEHVVALARRAGEQWFDPTGENPLRSAVLTATLLGAFEEARRHWLAAHPAGPVDDDARADFLAAVWAALDTVRPAFDFVRPSPDASRATPDSPGSSSDG